MKIRSKVESEIRDWLSLNLDFIDKDLKLIQKEFYLKDDIGANGYVDLLCKDSYNNFVIIEIKRSETSARQTISEILKYHALIKHNFNARESEIKIIIISTHWQELIRPYSETIHRTTYDLVGYKINIDESSKPIFIEKIEPLDRTIISRKFAFWQGLYMFKTPTERQAFYTDIQPYLISKGPSDFVIVSAHADITNPLVIFPYGIIISFQKLAIAEVLTTIQNFNKTNKGDLLTEDYFKDEPDYHKYLEGEMINAIDTFGHYHERESCYPQKINVMINAENWIIEKIDRFGIFGKDPRYNDELLLNELMGLDGNSDLAFQGIAESTQLERVKEIQRECTNSLMPSPIWQSTIAAIFEELKYESRKFRIQLHISNQKSLLFAIYHVIKNKEPLYLPSYHLLIEYLDSNEVLVYKGCINWNLNTPSPKYFKPLPSNENGKWLAELVYGKPDNNKAANEQNLRYTTAKYLLVNGKSKFTAFIEAKNGKLVTQLDYLFPFLQYVVTVQDQLSKFVRNVDRTYIVMKRP